ncbi:MAG: hypothetical protein GTN65_07810, partial [Armatimonadetes bacterium]|nr:hypothetical protein [Armatimonadota bacterium]NIO96990.1 hypothetical protein [Armatimonadota bacterium]
MAGRPSTALRVNKVLPNGFLQRGSEMANLYGKPVNRKELEARVSHMGQVAGVRLATLEEGTSQGV